MDTQKTEHNGQEIDSNQMIIAMAQEAFLSQTKVVDKENAYLVFLEGQLHAAVATYGKVIKGD